MRAIEDFADCPAPRVVVGADHGGFALKQALLAWFAQRGLTTTDVGAHALDAEDDYPDFAAELARRVSRHQADCGVLICRSGIGMSINANRFPEVRAALATTEHAARLSRQHNAANVLVVNGDDLTAEALLKLVAAWLATPFSKEARHARRLLKIEQNSYDDIAPLRSVDPEIAGWIDAEKRRQDEIIELIASENIASAAVRAAAGSCLTNKYAEGYPGKRYYGGCDFIDHAERLAIERAMKLFGAEAANVQPHSGSQANMAVYFALLEPGARVLAMDLAHGGHLTHGQKMNFSGRLFHFNSYGVDRASERLDYDAIERQAREFRPQLLVAGASAYSRFMDYARLRQIADAVGAYLMVDMAHVAGLVAVGLHPNPVPWCDVVTSTTHKTLRGPRGGLILAREKLSRQLNSQVFPGLQGGPLMHIVAAKAVCFREAMTPAFRVYQEQVLRNAQTLATALTRHGFRIVSGGTDNHLMLVDLRPLHVTGQAAETALDRAGITANKNLIPFDPEKPTVTSGLRVGTPTVTTRGMKEPEMERIAEWIHRVVTHREDEAVLQQVRREVVALTRGFPPPEV